VAEVLLVDGVGNGAIVEVAANGGPCACHGAPLCGPVTLHLPGVASIEFIVSNYVEPRTKLSAYWMRDKDGPHAVRVRRIRKLTAGDGVKVSI
jgi:hypothetical protein